MANVVVPPRRARVVHTRRAWTQQEEQVLVGSLKALLSKGWRTDNGFRPGYLARLEEAIKLKFPGTDIKGTPHFNSKLTTWKKTFYLLQGVLSLSGVGFNESTYMIDCTDEVWQHVVSNDPNAQGLRYKQFPLYPTWIEFYGKDRANGSRTEDVIDAINNLVIEDQFGVHPHPGDYRVNLEHIMEEHDEVSVCQDEEPSRSTTKQPAKKRKTDTLDRMCEMVGKLVQSTEKIDTLAAYVGYEHNLGEKRAKLDSVISEIPELTVSDTLEVGEVFAQDAARMEYFLGLAVDKKAQYVRRLLSKLDINLNHNR